MAHYFSLGASLPMLKRDESPVMGMESFLAACSEWLPPGRFEYLERLDLIPGDEPPGEGSGAATKYLAWERSLRNRLTRIRAGKLGADPEAHCLPDKEFHQDAERVAQEAYMAPDPLEREKLLDAARWRLLEDLELGHFFDFDMLCLYKLKLIIREKWQRRDPVKATANLDAATAKARSLEKPSEQG